MQQQQQQQLVERCRKRPSKHGCCRNSQHCNGNNAAAAKREEEDWWSIMTIFKMMIEQKQTLAGTTETASVVETASRRRRRRRTGSCSRDVYVTVFALLMITYCTILSSSQSRRHRRGTTTIQQYAAAAATRQTEDLFSTTDNNDSWWSCCTIHDDYYSTHQQQKQQQYHPAILFAFAHVTKLSRLRRRPKKKRQQNSGRNFYEDNNRLLQVMEMTTTAKVNDTTADADESGEDKKSQDNSTEESGEEKKNDKEGDSDDAAMMQQNITLEPEMTNNNNNNSLDNKGKTSGEGNDGITRENYSNNTELGDSNAHDDGKESEKKDQKGEGKETNGSFVNETSVTTATETLETNTTSSSGRENSTNSIGENTTSIGIEKNSNASSSGGGKVEDDSSDEAENETVENKNNESQNDDGKEDNIVHDARDDVDQDKNYSNYNQQESQDSSDSSYVNSTDPEVKREETIIVAYSSVNTTISNSAEENEDQINQQQSKPYIMQIPDGMYLPGKNEIENGNLLTTAGGDAGNYYVTDNTNGGVNDLNTATGGVAGESSSYNNVSSSSNNNAAATTTGTKPYQPVPRGWLGQNLISVEIYIALRSGERSQGWMVSNLVTEYLNKTDNDWDVFMSAPKKHIHFQELEAECPPDKNGETPSNCSQSKMVYHFSEEDHEGDVPSDSDDYNITRSIGGKIENLPWILYQISQRSKLFGLLTDVWWWKYDVIYSLLWPDLTPVTDRIFLDKISTQMHNRLGLDSSSGALQQWLTTASYGNILFSDVIVDITTNPTHIPQHDDSSAVLPPPPSSSIPVVPGLINATTNDAADGNRMDRNVWTWQRYVGLYVLIATVVSTTMLMILARYNTNRLRKKQLWGNGLASHDGVEEILALGWSVDKDRMVVFDKSREGYYSDVDSTLFGGYVQTLDFSQKQHNKKKQQSAAAADDAEGGGCGNSFQNEEPESLRKIDLEQKEGLKEHFQNGVESSDSSSNNYESGSFQNEGHHARRYMF